MKPAGCHMLAMHRTSDKCSTHWGHPFIRTLDVFKVSRDSKPSLDLEKSSLWPELNLDQGTTFRT